MQPPTNLTKRNPAVRAMIAFILIVAAKTVTINRIKKYIKLKFKCVRCTSVHRQLAKSFDKNPYLDAGFKARNRRQFRKALREQTQNNFIAICYLALLLVFYYIAQVSVICVFLIDTPNFLAHHWLYLEPNVGNTIKKPYYVLDFIAIIFLVRYLSKNISSLIKKMAIRADPSFWVLGVLALSMTYALWLLHANQTAKLTISYEVKCAIFASTGLWWSVVTSRFLIRILGSTRLPTSLLNYNNHWRFIARIYLDLNTIIENVNKQDNDTQSISKIITSIDNIALVVQTRLGAIATTTDTDLQSWMKGRASGYANAIKMRRQWITSPKPDTPQVFLTRMHEDFVNIANGWYDNLECSEIDDQHPAGSVRTTLHSIVIHILIAAFPVIVLVGIHKVYPHYSLEPIYKIVIPFVAVQVLSVLGLNLEKNISTIKEISEIASFGK